MSDSRPIGIFDSGLGGLTVMRAVRRVLPNESIVYVGDTARIPYGPKSPEVIRRFSLEIGSYLERLGVKVIVTACNTASAFGLSALTETLSIPVMGVVIPGARAAVKVSETGRIGVIGTRGTVLSQAYQNAILALKPDAMVAAVPAPLLVPMVEEGFREGELLDRVFDLYLPSVLEKRIDVLVLGCTHYPLLVAAVSRYLEVRSDLRIKVVDSAGSTASDLAELLRERGLESEDSNVSIRFLATDDPNGFAKNGSVFLGAPIPAVAPLSLEELARAAYSAGHNG